MVIPFGRYGLFVWPMWSWPIWSVVDMVQTRIILSLCIKSSSLNFLPCTLKIVYLFRQNASASGGLLPLDPAGELPSIPQTHAPLQESLVPLWLPNSGSLEPPLMKAAGIPELQSLTAKRKLIKVNCSNNYGNAPAGPVF